MGVPRMGECVAQPLYRVHLRQCPMTSRVHVVNAVITVVKAKIIQPRVDEVSRMIVLGILIASIVLQRIQRDYHILSKKLRQKEYK